MAKIKDVPAARTYELSTVHDVVERYQLEGPHATVVMLVPTPGEVGDDLSTRWNARRTQLAHAGAGARALDLLDVAVRSIDPRGEMVLLTANNDGAAHCWLVGHDVAPMVHVGEPPALLHAVDELIDRATVVAAIVDRVGADIYCVDHLGITAAGSVTGDEVETHIIGGRGAPAGRSGGHTGNERDSYQRRADLVYERNADIIARALTEQAVTSVARLIVLTGDDREVAAVEQHLDAHRFTVRPVQAGARNDARSIERLHRAVLEESAAQRRGRRAEAVDELRRALGQHSLGVEGRAATTDAVREGRAATLFLDRANLTDDADEIARDALLHGGDVVVVDELGVDDGIAVLLRYAAG
jgi:Bacterial archaeo-eukaryotic release factor family 2